MPNILCKTIVPHHCTTAVAFCSDGIVEYYWWQHMLCLDTSSSVAQNESPMQEGNPEWY